MLRSLEFKCSSSALKDSVEKLLAMWQLLCAPSQPYQNKTGKYRESIYVAIQ